MSSDSLARAAACIRGDVGSLLDCVLALVLLLSGVGVFSRQAAGLFESSAQDEIQLGIRTTELIVSPATQCVKDFGVRSQKK